MRIAFVSDVVYAYVKGGVEATEYTEMLELKKQHEIYTFSLRFKGMIREQEKDGITHIAFGYTNPAELYTKSGRRKILNALRFTAFLPLFLYRHRFDVIQTNAFPYLHIPIVKFYCRLARCKLIIDVAEVWGNEYWQNYIGRFWGRFAHRFANYALRKGDAYISNPGDVAHRLESIGVSKDSIFTFSPVLDRESVKKILAEGVHKKKRVVLSCRLIPEKRLDKWLEVVKKVFALDSGVTALLIGGGPEEQEVRASAERLKLGSAFELRPFYPDRLDAYREIRDSAVLLNMSEREGLGAVILDSLALGTPVVLPDYTTVPGEVKGMCTVSSEDALPQAVLKAIKDGARAIKNEKNLELFYSTNITGHYDQIFAFLGLH